LTPGLGRQFKPLLETEGGEFSLDHALSAPCVREGCTHHDGVVSKRGPAGLLPDVGRLLRHGFDELIAVYF